MRYDETTNDPPKAHYRTIFLSDIHLGTKGCRDDRLIHFLKHHDCETLCLVGDIVDGWRLRSNFYWPQAHNNVLRRFLTLMKRGTRIVFVTGNHDEFLRKYSDMEIGNLRLADQAVHETADGRRLGRVVHGAGGGRRRAFPCRGYPEIRLVANPWRLGDLLERWAPDTGARTLNRS